MMDTWFLLFLFILPIFSGSVDTLARWIVAGRDRQ